jgi:glycoside hydrolase-like protein/putative peptidoglycan binding protein
MPRSTSGPSLVPGQVRRLSAVAVATFVLAASAPGAQGDVATAGPRPTPAHTVAFHGYGVAVPDQWRVVRLQSRPHACVRFDFPTVYLGRPGDQSGCPAHLVGGAPAILIEPLDARSTPLSTFATVSAARSGAVAPRLLPRVGPVAVAVPKAGVVVTAVYGSGSASLLKAVLARGRVTAGATAAAPTKGTGSWKSPPAIRGSSPGNFVGLGFDACTAPSQSTMNAWHASSSYSSVGVYIGGISRGCAQPNLTADWVVQQDRRGWHLIPTYVGLQAPCTRFYNRMSSDPATAWGQGRAEAADAALHARALGISAPSTIYSDVEGYNNTIASCVTAVLSYVSGWNRGLRERGYDSGVYSSASSGIRDLAANYGAKASRQPDDIWIAWWNSRPDADGGSYVADALWSGHHRIHQYVGAVYESHGGYRLNIDKDYLDLTSAVPRPRGCPANIDFATYPVVRRGDSGVYVQALQCLLAGRGFNPGSAAGMPGWRTNAAVRAFKASRGLLETTVVRRPAWTALLSAGPRPSLQMGSTGPSVSRLQRALCAALQRTVRINGTYGDNTRRAVVDYQQARSLSVDGTATRRTWIALQAGR